MSSITMPSLVELGVEFMHRWGTQKTFFICLSVKLLNDIARASEFAQKLLQYRNDFDILGVRIGEDLWLFTLSVCHQVVPPQCVKVKNEAKILGRVSKLIQTKFGR